MLGIIDDVVKQAAALPNDQADAIWMKMFPTYHVDEDLGPVAASDTTLGISRSVVRINVVYSEFGGGHPFLESTPRMMKRYNRTSFLKHDPRYALINNGTDPAAIRVFVPVEYVSTFPTDHVWCHYIPVPTDPSTQAPEDTLDFEPMYYNSILNKANMLLMAGNQDYQSAEAMQMLIGGN